MFACMALGAFNDNYFKNALIILITYQLSQQLALDAATLISLASALFILPFFLCSGVAGALADRYAKARMVRWLKFTELLLFIAAAFVLIGESVNGMMLVLFLLGVQAAFFGPVKYAILPELVAREQLLAANGLVEAGTFLSILMGTILGGLVILMPQGAWWVGGSMVAMGALGLWFAARIPQTLAAEVSSPMRWNILSTTFAMLRHAFHTPMLARAIIGISWFWAIGATYLTQIPVFTKEVIGGDQTMVVVFLASFSVGIALGSLLCQRLLKGEATLRLAPFALLAMCVFGIDLWWISAQFTEPTDEFASLRSLLTHHTIPILRVLADFFLLSVAGGVLIVPLYTRLQLASEAAERGRTIASNNVMNALAITLASLAAAAAYALGAEVREVLLAAALMNLPIMLLYRDRSA